MGQQLTQSLACLPKKLKGWQPWEMMGRLLLGGLFKGQKKAGGLGCLLEGLILR